MQKCKDCRRELPLVNFKKFLKSGKEGKAAKTCTECRARGAERRLKKGSKISLRTAETLNKGALAAISDFKGKIAKMSKDDPERERLIKKFKETHGKINNILKDISEKIEKTIKCPSCKTERTPDLFEEDDKEFTTCKVCRIKSQRKGDDITKWSKARLDKGIKSAIFFKKGRIVIIERLKKNLKKRPENQNKIDEIIKEVNKRIKDAKKMKAELLKR